MGKSQSKGTRIQSRAKVCTSTNAGARVFPQGSDESFDLLQAVFIEPQIGVRQLRREYTDHFDYTGEFRNLGFGSEEKQKGIH